MTFVTCGATSGRVYWWIWTCFSAVFGHNQAYLLVYLTSGYCWVHDWGLKQGIADLAADVIVDFPWVAHLCFLLVNFAVLVGFFFHLPHFFSYLLCCSITCWGGNARISSLHVTTKRDGEVPTEPCKTLGNYVCL